MGELPAVPLAEAGPLAQTPEQAMVASPEAAGNRQLTTLPPVAAQDDAQAATPIDTALQAALGTSAPTATPAATDDDTAVDKEWIEKAKRIVAQTSENPYEQNRQLAHVKADYLQKRYGKVIKLAE